MAWTPNLTALNQVLAGFYSTPEEIRRVLTAAAVPVAYVNFSGGAMDVWFSALEQADKRRKIDGLIDATLADYPDDPALLRARQGALVPETGAPPDEATWRSDYEDDHLERLMEAQSSLLPVSFLARGMLAARSVALIQRPTESGTGFLIAGDLLVTNNHVLPTPQAAAEAVLHLNFEQTAAGADATVREFRLDPVAGFETSPEKNHDWTVVAVKGNPCAEFGFLEMHHPTPLDDEPLRWVNIVQHPMGGPKAIALYHNVVTYQDDDVILYMTDTQPGSSGSPVFDSDWRVVGLHRGFKYVKDPGKWRSRAYRNWGTAIGKVAQRER